MNKSCCSVNSLEMTNYMNSSYLEPMVQRQQDKERKQRKKIEQMEKIQEV